MTSGATCSAPLSTIQAGRAASGTASNDPVSLRKNAQQLHFCRVCLTFYEEMCIKGYPSELEGHFLKVGGIGERHEGQRNDKMSRNCSPMGKMCFFMAAQGNKQCANNNNMKQREAGIDKREHEIEFNKNKLKKNKIKYYRNAIYTRWMCVHIPGGRS